MGRKIAGWEKNLCSDIMVIGEIGEKIWYCLKRKYKHHLTNRRVCEAG
jgi:hypothetical protein